VEKQLLFEENAISDDPRNRVVCQIQKKSARPHRSQPQGFFQLKKTIGAY